MNNLLEQLDEIADRFLEICQLLFERKLLNESKQFSVSKDAVLLNARILKRELAFLNDRLQNVSVKNVSEALPNTSFQEVLRVIQNINDIRGFMDELLEYLPDQKALISQTRANADAILKNVKTKLLSLQKQTPLQAYDRVQADKRAIA